MQHHHTYIGNGLIADPNDTFWPSDGIGIDLAAAYDVAPHSGLIQINWTNQGGLYFNTPANWSNDQTPENVDSGTITLTKAENIYSIGSRIGALMTNSLVTLAIPDYGPDNSFTIGTGDSQSSTFSNGGSVLLEAKADTVSLIIASPTLTLSGGGTIDLFNDGSNNEIIAASAGDTLKNVDNLIAGGGQLGAGGLALLNEAAGIIDADVNGTLAVNTGSSVITNNGLLESTYAAQGIVSTLALESDVANGKQGVIAAAGGDIVLDGITVTGGTVSATGGTVYLQNATLNGCTLTTSGTGAIGQSTNTGTLMSVTNEGTFGIGDGQQTFVEGTLVNDGLIALLSDNQQTELVISSPTVTLSGTGTILLDQTAGDTSANYIIGATASDELDNADGTIAGGGNLGGGTLTLVNNGTIDASSAYQLVLDTGVNAVTNTGLIEATSGNGLVVESVIENAGGTLLAAGANIYLQSGTIAGGTLNSSGGSALGVTQDQVGTLDGTSKAVTNLGAVDIESGGTLVVTGKLYNGGIVSLLSNNATTEFVVGAAGVTLTGTGTIALAQSSGDTNGNFIIGAAVGDELDNVSNTIAGGGNLGAGTLTLVNGGTIDADSGYALILNTGAVAATNTGLMESTGSGGFFIESIVDNKGGTITGHGGNVVLDAGTIAGGTVTSAGEGAIIVQGGQAGTLDGSANAVTNTGAIDIQIGGTLDVLGTLVNQGSITLLTNNATTKLLVDSPTLTLSGGGTLTLFQNSGDTVGDYVVGAASGDTLDNANNTINGGGYLGDGTLALINGGIIDANSGYALQLNTGSTGENLAGGEFLATGSGGLGIQNGAYTNMGLIEAENGSAVTFQNGATLTNSANGTLTGGIYEAASTGNGATISVTGSAITVDAADIILSGGGASIIFGGTEVDSTLTTITSAGTLSLLNGRNFTASANGGAFTDGGALVLSGASFSASTLTIAGGGTVSGNGTVTGVVLDSGTIASSGGTLSFLSGVSGSGGAATAAGSTLEFAAGGTIDGKVVNAGTIEAVGGLLTFAKSVGGAGTVDIGATGTLSLLDGAAAGQVIDFLAASGLLDLAAPTKFHGAISGFGGSDTIDLVNTTETSYHYANGVLTVKDDGKRVAAIHFDGSYTNGNFLLTSDGHGGTLINFQT